MAAPFHYDRDYNPKLGLRLASERANERANERTDKRAVVKLRSSFTCCSRSDAPPPPSACVRCTWLQVAAAAAAAAALSNASWRPDMKHHTVETRSRDTLTRHSFTLVQSEISACHLGERTDKQTNGRAGGRTDLSSCRSQVVSVCYFQLARETVAG